MVTKLTLEYDGTGFAGWARQPGKRTVQEELERALRTVLGEHGHDGEPLRLTVAGRTDAGVHAWGQVASYAHEAVDPLRLNGAARRRRRGARRRAGRRRRSTRAATPRSRTYCYRVLARRTRSAFERGRAFWWPATLDRDAARRVRASARRAGTTSPRSRPPRPSTRASSATCSRAEWRDDGDLLEFWIEADMFLRHMNRVLVGTMLEVAAGGARSRIPRRCSTGARARRPGAPRPRTGWRWRASPTLTRCVRGGDLQARARLGCIGARAHRQGPSGPYAGRAMLNVLLTNDDGIEADGLQALRRALVASPGVRLAVIAPDGNRSAMARSITTRRPLWVAEVPFADGTSRLRHRRHAGRLRAAREPRPGRGLRGRPGRRRASTTARTSATTSPTRAPSRRRSRASCSGCPRSRSPSSRARGALDFRFDGGFGFEVAAGVRRAPGASASRRCRCRADAAQRQRPRRRARRASR